MGSETESRMRGGSKGRGKGRDGGMCVRERGTSEADAADGEMVGVWMDGRGQIKGGRRRRQETLRETGEREKCPVRRWLFRMACCQPLMTALK